MWFETIQKKNKNVMKDLQFIPVKVLQMWECKKCLNIIFSKKYTFSPFIKETDLQSQNWQLENVNLKIQQNQKPLHNIHKVSSNQKFSLMNSVKVYCRVCQQILIGQFRPVVDFTKSHLKYEFICENDSIKKTKILTGQSNYSQISIGKSLILRQNQSLQNLKILKHVCKQINQYVALFYYSMNLKIYKPFISESKKNQQYLMDLKSFMMKTKSRKQKNEKESLRFRLKQNSCSYNSAQMTL